MIITREKLERIKEHLKLFPENVLIDFDRNGMNELIETLDALWRVAEVAADNCEKFDHGGYTNCVCLWMKSLAALQEKKG